MGFGIPAAVGAAISAPHRKIVAVVGDGGMAITGLELLTAIREGLNLTVIVFNDGYLGLVRRNQLENYGKNTALRFTTLISKSWPAQSVRLFHPG